MAKELSDILSQRMSETKRSSSRDTVLQPVSQPRKTEITEKYGCLGDFCRTFNPERQVEYCAHKDRCFFGTAPTLAELNMAYSQTAARFWLHFQILDLCRYTNSKRMSDEQVTELAAIIALRYYYLKTTELMYFFYMMKSGDFGKFYGSVDPMAITDALKQFIRYRNNEYVRKEQEEMSAREASWKKNAITYQQYLELRTREQETAKNQKE